MKAPKLTVAMTAMALSAQIFAQTIVTVNGTKIDSSEIDARAKFVQQQSQGQVQDTPELRQFIANEVVVETVVTQEAKRLHLNRGNDYKTIEADALKQAREKGLDKQPDFKANWARFQNQLLMEVYGQHIVKQNPVTDAQLKTRYDEVKARYQNTEEVQVGEIVTEKAEQAQAAIRELVAKKPFADVARKYSIDPNVKAGQPAFGEYAALVDLKEDRPKIYAAIQNLRKGEFTRTPVNGEKIFVVFYVNDKRKVNVESFDKVRDNLRQSMENERVQNAVAELMSKAKIEPAAH